MDTQQRRPPDTRHRKKPVSKFASGRSAGTKRKAPPKSVSHRSGVSSSRHALSAPVPEVTYIPAKPLNRNRFLLHLATVVAVVIAFVFGISIFFKVDREKTRVSGNHKYSAYAVMEASGIQDGDNLLTMSRGRASGKIIDALPYVKNARIGIKLPDTVHIEIEELEVAYAIQDDNNGWWLMTSEGRVVEKAEASTARDYTNLLGVRLDNPEQGAEAVAKENVYEPPAAEEGETIPLITEKPEAASGMQQLNAVLKITQCLEANDMIGTAKKIDVTNLEKLQLWYGDQFQVELGDISQMDYKISCMKSAIDGMKKYQSGILDVSFTIWPDMVGFTPS